MKVITRVHNDDQSKVAVVYYDRDDWEYVVKFFRDGEYQEEADYFTSNKTDAIGTANHYVDAN